MTSPKQAAAFAYPDQPLGATRSVAAALPRWRAWLVLGLLTAGFAISFIDRYLLAVMIEPIKADLRLSDTQIGILTGFAFSLFYALFALPIARLADTRGPRGVIVGSLVVWSFATGACGFAANFWQLALARFSVGTGEAGCVPASQIIIFDLFAERSRNTALAVFSGAGSIALSLAFAVGGLLEPRVGWRTTFVIASAPGLVLAAANGLLLPAAGRSGRQALTAQPAGRPAPLRALAGNKAFLHMPFLFAACAILQLGQLQWLPAFLQRSFSLRPADFGGGFALIFGPMMLAGTILAGLAADNLSKRNPEWPLRIIGLSAICSLVPSVILYNTHDPHVAIAMALANAFFVGMPGGPVFAFLQKIVDKDLRATAVSVALIGSATLGLGGGPLLTGVLSDMLRSSAGPDALRYALLITCVLVTGWLLAQVAFLSRLRQVRDPNGQG